MKGNVGDKVRFPKENQPHGDPSREYTIGCLHPDINRMFLVETEVKGTSGETCSVHRTKWVSTGDYKYELIKKPMSSLRDTIKLAFKKEPEKSFIKIGILDSNEELTQDGRDLVLKFLLEQNKELFKKEIVDPILAEMEANK